MAETNPPTLEVVGDIEVSNGRTVAVATDAASVDRVLAARGQTEGWLGLVDAVTCLARVRCSRFQGFDPSD